MSFISINNKNKPKIQGGVKNPNICIWDTMYLKRRARTINIIRSVRTYVMRAIIRIQRNIYNK